MLRQEMLFSKSYIPTSFMVSKCLKYLLFILIQFQACTTAHDCSDENVDCITLYDDSLYTITYMYEDYGKWNQSSSSILSKVEKEEKILSNVKGNICFFKGYCYTNVSSMNISDSGLWVSIVKNNNRISFDYYHKIGENKHCTDKLDEGVYVVTDSFVKIGGLSSFTSLHDLNAGTYFVTSPGFFYEEKYNLKVLFENPDIAL